MKKEVTITKKLWLTCRGSRISLTLFCLEVHMAVDVQPLCMMCSFMISGLASTQANIHMCAPITCVTKTTHGFV